MHSNSYMINCLQYFLYALCHLWYVLVWYGIVFYGEVRCGMALHVVIWYGLAWHG